MYDVDAWRRLFGSFSHALKTRNLRRVKMRVMYGKRLDILDSASYRSGREDHNAMSCCERPI